MNSIMPESYPVLQEYQALRTQLMDILSDEELAFSPGGENTTLGALCRDLIVPRALSCSPEARAPAISTCIASWVTGSVERSGSWTG